MKPKLEIYRARMDEADRRILDAIAERHKVVEEVAQLKGESKTQLRDLLREEAQLSRLGQLARERGLSAYFVKRLFRELIDYSVRVQTQHLIDLANPGHGTSAELRVAFQGAPGAYSHIAGEHFFSEYEGELQFQGHTGFGPTLEAVATGAADYAMLPVENTTAGSITEAYDLLARMDLSVVGEEVLRVEHCLVGFENVGVQEIRHVYSHPQALAQCSVFLSGLRDCTVQSFVDTAASVKKVADERDPSQAAIASERAAALYGLSVIARNLENQIGNYTRFMVVARAPLRFDERIRCKTSLIFSTRHEEGALVRCLNVLADQGLNLTKLESRPRPNSPFEYLFTVDFEGNIETEEVQRALEQIRAHTNFLKVLGSYPTWGASAKVVTPAEK